MIATDAIRRIIANVGPEPKSFNTALEVRSALAELDALEASHAEMYKALEEMLVAFSMENVGVSASLRRTSAKASARIALAKARGES